ncbi:hypothetical protein IMZ48_37050 [Candidatus Bathyarchaeota archaeon]|nr:hypothetical protein [Candidatus Bathyarchaeota archaeon]
MASDPRDSPSEASIELQCPPVNPRADKKSKSRPQDPIHAAAHFVLASWNRGIATGWSRTHHTEPAHPSRPRKRQGHVLSTQEQTARPPAKISNLSPRHENDSREAPSPHRPGPPSGPTPSAGAAPDPNPLGPPPQRVIEGINPGLGEPWRPSRIPTSFSRGTNREGRSEASSFPVLAAQGVHGRQSTEVPGQWTRMGPPVPRRGHSDLA